ncbi:MAG: helix-turn-helix transcriptional regulator [Trueperaceae bacterium]|nr:helix-turn-helix transcriptional regulator [Trueperaceae bacterium]
MKLASSSSSWLKVEDAEAARLIADPAAFRYLEPFIGRERSVSQVAAELGASISGVLYRVRQFERLGLVVRSRVEPRAGRPIVHYRSAADGYFVPFRATSVPNQEALAAHAFMRLREQLDASIGRAWVEGFGDGHPIGIQVYRSRQGRVARNIAPDPDQTEGEGPLDALLATSAPAVWDSWSTLNLGRDEAKALQRELAELMQRYRGSGGAGHGRYMVRVAMAPLAPGTDGA